MTTRVGLAISNDAIRALALRDKRITWAAEKPLEQGADLAAAIASLLAAAPATWLSRPVLCTAVGAHGSQVRLVDGLPEVQDADVLNAVLKENAGAFFLRNGATLITTRACPAGAGMAFAAAIEQPYAEAVRAACSALGWRLGFIAPSAIAMLAAVEDRSFSWVEGRIVVAVSRSDEGIQSIRTCSLSGADPESSSPTVVRDLAGLGDDALRYAAAYGVAATEKMPILALDPLAAGVWTRDQVRRRLMKPALSLLLATVFVLLSPLGALWAGHRAEGQLTKVRDDQWRTVTSTLADLDLATRLLEDMNAFAASRSSTTRILGELASTLPEASTIVSFELGDSTGQLIVLTAKTPAVLAAIERLPGARAVEVVGPLRRESGAAEEVQRVTIRWQRGGQ